MAHYPAEDLRRLHESRLDLATLPDDAAAAALTDAAPLQGAVLHQRDAYGQAAAALRAAVEANQRELRETHAARAALEDQRLRAVAGWGFVRGKVQDALLNLDPEGPQPTAAELQRRQRLFTAVFPLSPSTLGEAAFADIVTHLQGAATALQDGGALQALGLHERLNRSADALQTTIDAWMRETREDREATEVVWKARAAFDKAQGAYADQLRSVLRPQDRLGELGRWLRAEDAAYKARRAANTPIEQEPDFVETPGSPPPP